MKKVFFTAMLFITLVMNHQAQAPTLGVIGGFNFAKWKLGYKSTSFENKARVGIFGGVNAEWMLKNEISMQTELLYAQFGSKFEDDGEYARYKTSYLLLPVLGKYNFRNGISLSFGPQLGLLMSAKSDIDGEKYNFKDEMKKTDFFLVFGAEYRLKNGLRLGFRVNHGLSNVENGASTSLHNRGFALTANYKLKSSFKEVLQAIF